MKTILVPTDFSVNADIALYYAIELAKKENAKLILFNAYRIDYANAYVPYDLLNKEIEDAKKESQKLLKEAALKVSHAGQIKHESVSVEGFTVEAILNAVNEMKIDLVVMGTKGASGITGAVFGSNTAKVIERAKCPVIAVPKETNLSGIKKITYATAYNHSDIGLLKKVLDIAEPFNAQINIVHISDGLLSPETEKEIMKTFMEEVRTKVRYPKITFEVLTGNNVEDALEAYLKTKSGGLLVMSTHYRDFFDKLFGKSITRQMVYHTKVPLMAFHSTVKASEMLV